jgi:hypothetical protein
MNKIKWENVKVVVYEQMKDYLMYACSYEPNNEILRNSVKKFLTNIMLKCLVDLKVLSDIEVKCDESVNTNAVVGANAFKLRFCWKESPKHEWTVTEFTLAPDGMKLIEKAGGED